MHVRRSETRLRVQNVHTLMYSGSHVKNCVGTEISMQRRMFSVYPTRLRTLSSNMTLKLNVLPYFSVYLKKSVAGSDNRCHQSPDILLAQPLRKTQGHTQLGGLLTQVQRLVGLEHLHEQVQAPRKLVCDLLWHDRVHGSRVALVRPCAPLDEYDGGERP